MGAKTRTPTALGLLTQENSFVREREGALVSHWFAIGEARCAFELSS